MPNSSSSADEPRRRIFLVAAALLISALVLVQVLLPRIAASKIEDRLTENGGEAHVSVGAFPAVKLLWGDGGSIKIEGSGMRLDPNPQPSDVFKRLDGFGEVDVKLTDFSSGPIDIAGFELHRTGSEPYEMTGSAETTLDGLAAYTGSQGGALTSILGNGLSDLLGSAGSEALPIEIDLKLETRGSKVEVVDGGSTVAGFPTGPIGELVAEAVVDRI